MTLKVLRWSGARKQNEASALPVQHDRVLTGVNSLPSYMFRVRNVKGYRNDETHLSSREVQVTCQRITNFSSFSRAYTETAFPETASPCF